MYYALRNELWKMFGKKRTYIGFGAFLVAHGAILLLFRFWHAGQRDMLFRLNLAGYNANHYISNLTMALLGLVPMASLLLPLYVALVGGDLLAKEAEDGTLRMILARPISRFHLALVKWIAGVIFSLILTVVMGALGIGLASCLFPSGGLFSYLPEGIFSVFESGPGWIRYVSVAASLSASAVTIMGIALMFSCFNIKPAAATILALSVLIISRILQEMPYFRDLKQWFLTYHMNFSVKLLEQHIPWPDIVQSLFVLAGVNITLLIVGCVAFQVRDIKS